MHFVRQLIQPQRDSVFFCCIDIFNEKVFNRYDQLVGREVVRVFDDVGQSLLHVGSE